MGLRTPTGSGLANWVVVVLPRIMAPAARSAATHAESRRVYGRGISRAVFGRHVGRIEELSRLPECHAAVPLDCQLPHARARAMRSRRHMSMHAVVVIVSCGPNTPPPTFGKFARREVCRCHLPLAHSGRTGGPSAYHIVSLSLSNAQVSCPFGRSSVLRIDVAFACCFRARTPPSRSEAGTGPHPVAIIVNTADQRRAYVRWWTACAE